MLNLAKLHEMKKICQERKNIDEKIKKIEKETKYLESSKKYTETLEELIVKSIKECKKQICIKTNGKDVTLSNYTTFELGYSAGQITSYISQDGFDNDKLEKDKKYMLEAPKGTWTPNISIETYAFAEALNQIHKQGFHITTDRNHTVFINLEDFPDGSDYTDPGTKKEIQELKEKLEKLKKLSSNADEIINS